MEAQKIASIQVFSDAVLDMLAEDGDPEQSAVVRLAQERRQ